MSVAFRLPLAAFKKMPFLVILCRHVTRMNHCLYDKYASTHVFAELSRDKLFEWKRDYFRAHFAPLLPHDHQASILEIGCGLGIHLQLLAEHGYAKVQGVDLSPEQVNYAREKLGLQNIDLAEASGWLVDKEAAFDCILCLDVLEHLPLDELMRMGQQIRRALKPNGTLVVQVPNGVAPMNPIVYHDLSHVRAFTPASLRQFFLVVGLEPVLFCEAPRFVTGVKSAIQRVAWTIVFRPAIAIASRLLYGHFGPAQIYTANMLAVARCRG